MKNHKYILAAVFAASFSTGLAAQEVWEIGMELIPGVKSTVTVSPLKTDGVVAEVIFVNELVNTFGYSYTRVFIVDGIPITVMLSLGVGSAEDIMYVTVPEGIFVYPEQVTIGEGENAKILIFDLNIMGMS